MNLVADSSGGGAKDIDSEGSTALPFSRRVSVVETPSAEAWPFA